MLAYTCKVTFKTRACDKYSVEYGFPNVTFKLASYYYMQISSLQLILHVQGTDTSFAVS